MGQTPKRTTGSRRTDSQAGASWAVRRTCEKSLCRPFGNDGRYHFRRRIGEPGQIPTQGWLENLNKIVSYEGISMIAVRINSRIISAKDLKYTFHKITTRWREWIRSYTWKLEVRKWNLVACVAGKVSRSKSKKCGIVWNLLVRFPLTFDNNINKYDVER